MPRLWKSDVKWSPNWSPNPEKMRKNDGNKSMQKRTRPPGYARRVGGYGGRPLLRLNNIFSSLFRLVFVSASPKSSFGCLLPRFIQSCLRFGCLPPRFILFGPQEAERSIAKATDASHIVCRRPVSRCEFESAPPHQPTPRGACACVML